MANDWIPHSDADFDPWQKNYLSYATANTASLGLVPGDVTPLTNAQAVWTAAQAAHVAAQAAAQSAAQNKDNSRAAFETALRALTQQIQTHPAVTDAQRAGLGIPVRAKTRTPGRRAHQPPAGHRRYQPAPGPRHQFQGRANAQEQGQARRRDGRRSLGEDW